MAVSVYRNYHKWKLVKAAPTKDVGECPRCHNHKPYQLVYDAEEFGLIGILTFKYAKTYAFKCSVCPNYELISPELAQAVLKGK